MNVKRSYFVIISILILFWPCTVYCQPDTNFYHVKHIKTDEQLGHKGFVLYKDFVGFIWIGSGEGLSRYDGRNFINYTKKDGLTQNIVFDIKEDNDHKLYVASSAGISVYASNSKQIFTPLPLPKEIKDVSTFLPDSKNKMLIADQIAHVVWLIKDNKTSKIAGIDELIYFMVKDKDGIVYAMSRQNNIFIIKNDRLLVKFSLPKSQSSLTPELYQRLETDIKGEVLYFGNELYKLSATKPYLIPVKANATDAYYNFSVGINKYNKRTIYISEQGNWLPIAELDGGASENCSISVDDNKNILFTGDGQGLMQLTPRSYTILPAVLKYRYEKMHDNFNLILKLDSTIDSNKIAEKAFESINKIAICIFIGKDGTVWFCTYNGLYYLIKGKGELKHYSFGPPNIDINFNLFSDVIETDKGKTWFITRNGLVCYDGEKFTHWNSKNGLNDDEFYSFGVSGSGKFYAGSNSLYAEVNGVPVNISKNLGLEEGQIYSIDTDKGGNIWICSNPNLLYQIKQNKKGEFYKADSITGQINDLPVTIRSIAFDKVGNLWAAGPNNMFIYLLQPSGKFSDEKRLVLSKHQFLQNEDDQRITLSTNEDQTIIYLGWTAFNAQEVIKNFNVQKINIELTDVMLNHKKTNWGLYTDSINKYGIPTTLELKSKQNNITFHFAAICFEERMYTRYSHKLEGLEDDWQPLSNLEVADYTNLGPGDYTFYVKSINQNGLWSEPKTFSFTIKAIWYKTSQALVLWGFLLALSLLGIIKYRINKIQNKLRIDKLLIEQQLKAIRAQINPHFIQNSMEFLMQSIEKESPKTIHNIVEQLSLYLRHILSMSDKNIVTLEDELEFSEEYLSINKLLFNRNFIYKIDIEPEIDTFSIKIPAMLLQPFLENALKYGVQFAEGEEAVIHLKVTQQGRFIICNVTNNYLSTNNVNELRKNIPKGLKITEERLSLLYPKEKLSELIYFKIENNFYIATICIPIEGVF